MVTYSSLDEVYGRDFTNKYNDKLVSQDEFTKVKFNQDPIPLFLQNKGYNQENCFIKQGYYANLFQSDLPMLIISIVLLPVAFYNLWKIIVK